eukprot:3368437-Amphidinium_carterae.1
MKSLLRRLSKARVISASTRVTLANHGHSGLRLRMQRLGSLWQTPHAVRQQHQQLPAVRRGPPEHPSRERVSPSWPRAPS